MSSETEQDTQDTQDKQDKQAAKKAKVWTAVGEHSTYTAADEQRQSLLPSNKHIKIRKRANGTFTVKQCTK